MQASTKMASPRPTKQPRLAAADSSAAPVSLDADGDDGTLLPPTLDAASRAQQRETLEHLEALARSEADLTLELDDGEFRTSRLVLMASCQYFRRMLSRDWESGARRLRLAGVECAVFRVVHAFLCSGAVDGLTATNAQKVFMYADMVGVEPLCGACRRVLEPDAAPARPPLGAFRALVCSAADSEPGVRQRLAAAHARGDPADYVLVVQMNGGSHCFPLGERRPNATFGDTVDVDDEAGWPRSGLFRWPLPSGASPAVVFDGAALWRRADNRFCVFRCFGQTTTARSGRYAGGTWSDADWPGRWRGMRTTAAAPAGEGEGDGDEEDVADDEDEDEDGAGVDVRSLAIVCKEPLVFRTYQWPKGSGSVVFEMDVQLGGKQLAALLGASSDVLLEWQAAPASPV